MGHWCNLLFGTSSEHIAEHVFALPEPSCPVAAAMCQLVRARCLGTLVLLSDGSERGGEPKPKKRVLSALVCSALGVEGSMAPGFKGFRTAR